MRNDNYDTDDASTAYAERPDVEHDSEDCHASADEADVNGYDSSTFAEYAGGELNSVHGDCIGSLCDNASTDDDGYNFVGSVVLAEQEESCAEDEYDSLNDATYEDRTCDVSADVEPSDEDVRHSDTSDGGFSDTPVTSDNERQEPSIGKLQPLPTGKRLGTENVVQLLVKVSVLCITNLPRA